MFDKNLTKSLFKELNNEQRLRTIKQLKEQIKILEELGISDEKLKER